MRAHGFPEEAKRQRAEAWVAAWSAIQRSTELVDRDRAERAMTALYRERSLDAPRFLWVDTPSDGVLAWHLVSRGHTPLRNPWTRGDRGSGDNRRFYQLQDPFRLEPAWQQRAFRRAGEYAPSGQPGGFDFEAGYSADARAVRATVDDHIHSADEVPRQPTGQGAGVAPDGDEQLAHRVIGDRWEHMQRIVGTEMLISVALEAVIGTAAHLLDVRSSQAEAARALTFPQFDRTIIGMGALPDVFGVALWRQLDERTERTAMVERRLELGRSGAAFWAFDRLAIMLERPSRIGFDSRGRLHAQRGPALSWSDGTTVWADHGVVVPERVIREPELLTVADIDGESNAEIRRVMIERFGAERLIREGGAELVGEDETGRLWRRARSYRHWEPEPLVVVEVVNSTPEPDGSVRTYYLRVPPDLRTARDAVAWTFGLSGSGYAPTQET